MSLSLLTVLGLVLLKLSMNVLTPRQWTLQQAISDAYMTYERSYAERVPFETLISDASDWPLYPSLATTSVQLGKLPGGTAITGTVSRTRVADAMNGYPTEGASGVAVNPSSMQVWKAQSVLTYRVGRRTYVKSRTVIRSQ